MIYYSYDVMFTLAFGHPMGFVKGEQNDVAQSILNTMTGGLTAMGVLMHTPWLMTALAVLLGLAGPMKQWTDWSVSQMKARMAVSSAIVTLSLHELTMIRSKMQNQISCLT
jgi:hypothetical protein